VVKQVEGCGNIFSEKFLLVLLMREHIH